MFKTQADLIQQIHNEFDTAQERLLSQANELLRASSSTSIVDISERLKSVGFVNTPIAIEGDKIRKEVVKSRAEAETINYYKFTYPFLKFLTEDELNRICDKYKLIHAPVANYIKNVPKKNLLDIERAQALRECDAEETVYRFKLKWKIEKENELAFLSALGKTEPLFTRNELHSLVVKFYNRYGADSWVPKHGVIQSTAFWVITERLPGVNQSSLYEEYITIDKSGLFIAAPPSHFNLDGLSKKSKYGFFNVFKQEIKDPIVFRYVRGGIQVITKWGLEAEDEALVVDKLN